MLFFLLFTENLEHKPKGYWLDMDNRKQFFADLAQQMRFNPLISENWNTITQQDVLTQKVFVFNVIGSSFHSISLLYLSGRRFNAE